MKIVMVIQNFYPSIGGAERQALTLARELVKRQVEVTVFTQNVQGLPTRDKMDGVAIVRRGCGPLSFMITIFFWLLSHRSEFDIIHVHIGSSHAVAAALAAKVLNKKIIIKLSGSNLVGEIPTSRQSFIGRLKLRALGWLKPMLVLVSSGQKQDLKGFGLDTLETRTIPNGVDTQKFQPAEPAIKNELRRKIGWEGVIFLFVGRFSPDKLRPDIFANVLAAWDRLKNEPGHAQLYFVGSGELESRYREMIQQRNLQKSVYMWPSSERVHELYRAADVFLLPSVTEGLSNALLEAIACGLPVAGSRVTGIKELIDEDVQGRLFDPMSVDEIHRSLSGLLLDADLRNRLGHSGVELAGKFSIQNTVERYIDLYRETERIF